MRYTTLAIQLVLAGLCCSSHVRLTSRDTPEGKQLERRALECGSTFCTYDDCLFNCQSDEGDTSCEKDFPAPGCDPSGYSYYCICLTLFGLDWVYSLYVAISVALDMAYLWSATIPLIFAALNCVGFASMIGNAWIVVPPSIPVGRSLQAHFHIAAIAAAEYAVLESLFVLICRHLPPWFPPLLLVWGCFQTAYVAYELAHGTRIAIIAWRLRNPDWPKNIAHTPQSRALATSQHPALFPSVLNAAGMNAAMQVSGMLVGSTAHFSLLGGHWMIVFDIVTVLFFLLSRMADIWLWKDLHGTMPIFKAIRAQGVLVCASLLVFLHLIRTGTRCLLGLPVFVPLGLAHWPVFDEDASIQVIMQRLDRPLHLRLSLLCFFAAILVLATGRRLLPSAASEPQDTSNKLPHANSSSLEEDVSSQCLWPVHQTTPSND